VANILIVDDDKQVASFLTRKLSEAGHTCHVEANGERALTVLHQGSFDLLILDVMLPGMSGFELCRRIHASTKLYSLPVLFLSAMNGEEEVTHGLAQGADDYVTKPFKPEVLLSRVQSLLHASAQSQAIDELTSLPGPRAIKLEIQRAITVRQGFALAYVEILKLGDFVRSAGDEGRMKAVRHLARGLQLCGEELHSEVFRVGHMGSGHFVCILEPNQAEAYCLQVRKLWVQHLPAFLKSLGVQIAAGGPPEKTALVLDLLFCIVNRDPSSSITAPELFEVLTRLRQNALASGVAGIHIDRRS